MSVVVVLNGTSSSGKTTVARAFQDAAPSLFLNFSIDSILSALPPSVLRRLIDGTPVPEVRVADLVRAFYTCTAELLRLGHHLVIDHAVTARYHAELLLDACEGHDALFVGVACPLDVACEREAARGDRRRGLAEQQYATVHTWLSYDLTIDTSLQSSSEAAAAILTALQSTHRSGAEETRRKLRPG